MKKLTKSSTDKMIWGVCGGFADFFGIDATIIRIIWAVFVLCALTGLLAYIICAIIMPSDNNVM